MKHNLKFSWQIPPAPVTETQIICIEFADVVIIGAGHAGTCAARAAAENNASVIVLEQQPEKSQWILGIGEIGHINSKWQKRYGVPEVDIDTFVNDWQLRTNNRSNYRLIRKYAEHCGDCFDWLIEPLSKEEIDTIYPVMTPQSEHFPRSLNGIQAWAGTAQMSVKIQDAAIKASQQRAKDKGARFFFEMRACQLVKNENRVSEVIAQDLQGNYIRFCAKKGVILAAGDYSKNKQMCEDLLVEAADLIEQGTDWSGHGWDGSGIQMGAWAGGRLEPRSHAALGGNYSFPGFDLIGSTAVLRVNKYGRRYSDEGFGTHVLAATAGAKQPNGMLWGIFDSNINEQITYQAPCHAVFDYTDTARFRKLADALERARQAGDQGIITTEKRPLYAADTLEQLAFYLFDTDDKRDTFMKTVERYNQMCYQCKDTEFGKEEHLLFPIDKAPFYACGQEKNSHHPGGQSLKLLVTVSGLLIDENQQVLNEEFEPIPGLFATGNCSGTRFGFQYTTSLPGQSISIAQTLGREVGRFVAELI